MGSKPRRDNNAARSFYKGHPEHVGSSVTPQSPPAAVERASVLDQHALGIAARNSLVSHSRQGPIQPPIRQLPSASWQAALGFPRKALQVSEIPLPTRRVVNESGTLHTFHGHSFWL